MTNSIYAMCSILFLIIVNAAHGEIASPRPGTIIKWDNDNYLSYDYSPRVKTKTETGVDDYVQQYIRLHVHRDGIEQEIDLTDPRYPSYYSPYAILQPHINEIKYRDSNNLWLISREGVGLGRAILYNIKDAKLIMECSGINFVLSPDGQKIAFYKHFQTLKKSIHQEKQYGLFVNGTMIFPAFARTKPIWDYTDEPLDTNKKQSLAHTVNASGFDFYLEPLDAPSWIDDHTLSFTFKTYDDDYENEKHHRGSVGGITLLGDTTQTSFTSVTQKEIK